MKSLFLAPLGMQPAAAVAPLLGLGLRPGDEIVILTTPAVEASGSHVRVESLLRERLPGVSTSYEPIDGAGSRDVDRSRPERVVLVANGGQALEVHALVDRLATLDNAPPVEIAMSLGTRGLRFDLAGSPIADFVVGDVGLDPLLELLGLERVAQGTVLRRKGIATRSIKVETLLERAGELYACVKIDPRPSRPTAAQAATAGGDSTAMPGRSISCSFPIGEGRVPGRHPALRSPRHEPLESAAGRSPLKPASMSDSPVGEPVVRPRDAVASPVSHSGDGQPGAVHRFLRLAGGIPASLNPSQRAFHATV